MTRVLSGNHASWLTTVAREIREAGKPVSVDFLCRVVPGQFATATNDGHVTAAENGLPRDDFAAGQRIWVEEAVAALRKAKLVDGPDDELVWPAPQDGVWKVPFRPGHRLTVYGRAESAAARDRHMLGDGSPGYLLKGWSEVPVDVSVGIAGAITKGRHTFQVHPLAFAVPPMTPEEQERVREDIEKHGVLQPLTLYADQEDKTARGKPKLKVLDGRHRLQFASALNKPVRVEVFDGDEQAARDYVASLNLHRRQLTTAQRALAINRLYGEPAKTEAKNGQIEGVIRGNQARSGGDPSPDTSVLTGDGESESGKWHERAWKMAGGESSGVTRAAVRQMAEVVDAPETAARVDAGEITNMAEARKQARAEKGLSAETKQNGRTHHTSVHAELGRAIGHLRNVLDETDLPAGTSTPFALAERLGELDKTVDAIHRTLTGRNLI